MAATSGDSGSTTIVQAPTIPDTSLTATDERRELRRYFRRRRRALGPVAQAAHAGAVARHYFARGLALRGRTIGGYIANDGELDPAPLLARLLASRKRVALPVVSPGGLMSFYRYGPDTPLVANRYGIPEPASGAPHVAPLALDVLLMPLVAFDRFGVRLGMGAGYYDRYLGRLPRAMRPRLVGLAHEAQRSLDPLPFAGWDVPLDGVVTETGWHKFDV